MTFLTVDGADLYYEVTDIVPRWRPRPETIVFHHGLGFNADIWSEWLPVLADRYRLVCFDVRGCGRSTVPESGYQWRFEGLTHDVLAIAEATQCGERFHFVGESLGGIIGYYLGIRHRHRVHTVVSISANHQGPRIGGNVRDWRRLIDEEGLEAWSRGMLESRFFPGAIPREQREWLHRIQIASPARTIVEVSAGLLRPMDLEPEIASITTPLLLVVGDHSPFVSVEALLDIRRAVKNASLQVVAGARHGVAISHARQCAELTRAFIERPAVIHAPAPA
jgi:pimeloyl-ACP methyl ester carboxylesterase